MPKKYPAELREANAILKAATIFATRELCATRRRVDRGGVRDLSRRVLVAARLKRWAVVGFWRAGCSQQVGSYEIGRCQEVYRR